MDDIFDKETEVINEADQLLQTREFASTEDKDHYKHLLEAYKRLLKQMRTMVRMSDIMQSKLNSMSSELEKLSQIDGLTGLYNRRYLNEIYQREWDKAIDTQTALGTLMVDIDHFKKYNDTFGHLAGDVCLQKIANSIEETASSINSFVGRFGGEEFLVLLPDSDLEQCAEMAQKILNNIESLNIPSTAEPSNSRVSISIGIGLMAPVKGDNLDTLIHIADQALYRAKNAGRNCFRT